MEQTTQTDGKRALGVALAIVLVLLIGASLSFHWMGSGPMGMHHRAMSGGVPAPYRGMDNPLSGSDEAIRAGMQLYFEQCAACHGGEGAGNGPAAQGLTPPPANLRFLVNTPMARDDYLFWRISEGGGRFNSAMPAFKGSLSDVDRWRIVAYLEDL